VSRHQAPPIDTRACEHARKAILYRVLRVAGDQHVCDWEIRYVLLMDGEKPLGAARHRLNRKPRVDDEECLVWQRGGIRARFEEYSLTTTDANTGPGRDDHACVRTYAAIPAEPTGGEVRFRARLHDREPWPARTRLHRCDGLILSYVTSHLNLAP